MQSRAVVIVEPEGPPVPVLFDSPHSGQVFPTDFGAAVPERMLRAGWDAYVDELFGTAPARGAALIAATFPRTYIDANRALEDLDATMVDGSWPGPVSMGPKTALGKGLIWRTVGADLPIYDRKLPIAEIEHRIERFWRPYNDALRNALDAIRTEWGGVWHINCHSMPSAWPPGNPGAGDPVTSDFILGDRDGTTCELEFRELVQETLTDLGYRVAVNDRFKGVQIVRTHGRPAENRHSLQIEITRTLYMSEDTLEKTSGFDALRADLDKLIAAVCTYARDRATSV